MPTHSVTVELSDAQYQSLLSKVRSGEYTTLSEAVQVALLDLDPPFEAVPTGTGQTYQEWLHSEASAAYDEHQANARNVFSSEQVLTWLEAERAANAG